MPRRYAGTRKPPTQAMPSAHRKPASQGEVVAENNIGYLYQNGGGVMKDYAQAMRWYPAAADRGDGDGEDNIGFLYQNGWGVPTDYGEAMRWYRLAADRGSANA